MTNARTGRKPRRKPSQARSAWTFDAILQASAQILEREGEAAVTTGHVAMRAGVSIGTLYQYFENRDALLIALATKEIDRLAERVDALIGKPGPGNPPIRGRAVIQAMIESYSRRRGARRQFALMAVLQAEKGQPQLQARYAELLSTAWEQENPTARSTRSKVFAYAMTNAVTGVLLAAARDNSPILKDPQLEEALIQIVLALRHPDRLDANRLDCKQE